MRKIAYSGQFEMLLNNMTTNPSSHLPESVKNMQEAATHYIMKSTETNGLSNAYHAIGSQLLGEGKTYVDLENNKIEQYTEKGVHPLNDSQGELTIPIAVQLSTGIPFLLFISKTQQVLIPLIFGYSPI